MDIMMRVLPLLVWFVALIEFNEGQKLNEMNRLISNPSPPKSAPASCQSIVVYYDGVFKNKKYPALKYPVQLQLRMTSNLTEEQYHLTIEGWNKPASLSSDFSMNFYYDGLIKWCEDLTVNNLCSGPFGVENDYFLLDLVHGNRKSWNNYFQLFYFDPFNRTFVLNNAIGKCTDDLPNFRDDWMPDPTLYKACLCCDSYKPHPSLNCPKSPWV